nr:MAG TPA: hypothetical protein [Caudoviricetes sp.]
MMEHPKLYFREDVQWWYLADNIQFEIARKNADNINMQRAIDYGFEVLANKEAHNYDSSFNFIIAHRDKDYLLKTFGNLF